MTPLINGINYSWASITVVIFGVPVVGITKIDYTHKQKKDNNYGMGTLPTSRGYGQEEFEGSIEIYTDELKRIIANSPGRDPLKIPPFDITIVYGADGTPPTKDILRACEFTEHGISGAQNDTKLLVKLPLVIGGIER